MPSAISAFRFRPRWWGLALAAAGCAAGIALGNWQLQRAADRQAVAASIAAAASAPAIEVPARRADPAALVHRNVLARGEFLGAHTVLLDNKLHRGRAGYHVIQPLRLADGDGLCVLVNRGWIAAGPSRDKPPVPVTPRGEQRIYGIAIGHLPHAYQPSNAQPAGIVRQNLAIEEFSAASGLGLQPFVIEQRSGLDDGLVRDWPKAGDGWQKNRAYALQWYALAALAVILFVALSVRREPPPSV